MPSEAQRRATKNFEKKAYFKTLVRFKKEDEERIRAAAGDSLNGFIVKCVLNALNAEKEETTIIEENSTPEPITAEPSPGGLSDAENSKHLAELQALLDEKKAGQKAQQEKAAQEKAEKEAREKEENTTLYMSYVERLRDGAPISEDVEKEATRRASFNNALM